jgi:hypothetical protein
MYSGVPRICPSPQDHRQLLHQLSHDPSSRKKTNGSSNILPMVREPKNFGNIPVKPGRNVYLRWSTTSRSLRPTTALFWPAT